MAGAAEETSGVPLTTGGSLHGRVPDRMAHHRRSHDRRPAVRRHHRREKSPRALREGVLGLPVRLRRTGHRLRHLGDPVPQRSERGQRRLRPAVLRRLAHRVQPVGRQPVHLHHHHGQLQGAPEVPAGSADGRHRAGADLPRHLHRPRRGGDQSVLLGLLRVRRVPGLHGLDAGQGHRARGRRRERRGAFRPDVPEHHRPVARAEALHQPERQAADDADVPGHPRARHHRPDLRARLDPRDLRPHPGAVPGLHRERVRTDGPAPAVLLARRPDEATRSTCRRGWRSSWRSSG